MKFAKQIIALILVLVMLFSFAGCHGKDEIAATSGNTTFTSAFYMCCLINADMAARTRVDTALSESGTDTSTTSVDYHSQTIEEKTFANWVKDTALDTMRRFAFIESKCKELGLTLSEEDIAQSNEYADYYWNSYGYSTLFSANGVAYDTYEKYMLYTAYEDKYFMHIYGEGGEKAIGDTEISDYMSNNYAIANILQTSFTNVEEATVNTLKSDFALYLTQLESGVPFENIYNDYYNVEETDEETTTSTDSENTPKDEYAQIVSAAGTTYESEYYDEIKAMAVGEVKLIILENDAGLVLIKKGDIMADSFYLGTLKETILYDIKYDEFDAQVKTDMASHPLDTVKYAINRFKVEKIEYPTYSY